MEVNFNIETLRLPYQIESLATRTPPELPRHKPGELFLMGPIPWRWLKHAATLPGKALHVAIALWLFSGIKKTSQVKLSLKWLYKETGIKRLSGARALGVLEDAGLVSVIRHTEVDSLS